VNHLAALERQERGRQSGRVLNPAVCTQPRRERFLELLDWLLLYEKAENAPGQAFRGSNACGTPFEPLDPSVNH